MSEVIKKWITNSIGIVINMNPDVFASEVMDGTIIAQILHSYNIISEEQRLKILPTDNPHVAFQNLQYIRHWLRAIGVHCSEEDIVDISNENCVSAVKLFYQIYLALQDKDELYYTAQRRGNERLHPTDTRFEVVGVNETTETDFVTFTDSPYSEQLVLKSGVIEWNKSRYETLASTYEAMRERYAKYLHQKFAIKQPEKIEKISVESATTASSIEELNEVYEVDHKEYTAEELMEQSENAIARRRLDPDPQIASLIVTKLKEKRKEALRANDLKLQQQRMLLMELWNQILTKQEKDLEHNVASKMLRQSMFEKQIATKMFEVRQQKNNILQNRRFVDEETSKRREEEFLEAVFLRDKSTIDQKGNYYFEKYRILELHQRIYAEKQRLKAARRKKLCSEIVDDLIDLSLKYYTYKDIYKTEPDERLLRQWGNLFVKSKSIFPYMEDLSEIVVDVGVPEGMEEIYLAEIERQEELDQREFEKYLNCEWPWDLDDLLTDYEHNLITIELGMNVLGHNVHRALYAKYPGPKRSKPDLPPVTVAACVNSMPNLKMLPALQKLLKKRRVKVIEIQEIVNFCLKAFQEESKIEEIDNCLIEGTEALLKVLDKEGVKAVPQKGSKSNKSLTTPEEDTYLQSFEERCTQTPKLFPCEELALSNQAELGKSAYELLNVGGQLTDTLIVAMIIEYLKNLKDIGGWVLIDYPGTLAQAVLLEEALSGRPIPNVSQEIQMELSVSIGDIADLDYRDPLFDLEKRNAILRKSRVLQNPNPPPITEPYDTYLTAYIRIKHENIRDEEAEEDFVEPPLEEFYLQQGCNYSLYYKEFRFSEIKRLAKMILGEYAIPPKTSCELFGDTVLYLEAKLNPPKPTKKPKSKKKKVPSTNEVSMYSPSIVEIEVVLDEEEPLPLPEPKAGEAAWQYVDLFIPEHFQVGLGTFWENLETIYVTDFKQLFFLKRMAFNAIVPYLTHVRNHMTAYLCRPDNKQTHLTDFQKYYNEISNDMRDDEEVKAEIHYIIAEFREKLWSICDHRMMESETERQEIIKDDWLSKQAIEIANITISAMQLELDRCCDSFQFMTDYYSGTVTKMPARAPPLQKMLLTKLPVEQEDETTVNKEFKDATVSILSNRDSSTLNTPFHSAIEQNCAQSQSIVTKFRSGANAVITTNESYFKTKGKKGKKGKEKSDKGKKEKKGKGDGKHKEKKDKEKKGKEKKVKEKKDKGSKGSSKKKSKKGSDKKSVKKQERQLPPFDEPEEDVKEAKPRIFEEWRCCLLGEYERASTRINMIKARGLQDIDSILTACQKCFHDLYDQIRERYQAEISSVNLACEVLARAVEAETPIQPQLILDDDKFYVEPNVLLFPDPPPEPEPPLEEYRTEDIFTINQLENFSNILASLAPQGSISERSFVFVLQDLIVQNAEDGKKSIVPKIWRKLTPQQVAKLSKLLFGDVEFIDWRDFIIYNMQLAYPTIDQLLQVRREFLELDPDSTEMVKYYEFFSIPLWFEDSFNTEDSRESFRLTSIKELLFKLYRIDEDNLNYTAFLLDFCKGERAVDGFIKALTLAYGKQICDDAVLGDLYVSNIKEQRFLDEQVALIKQLEHEELVKCTESVLSSLVTTAVHLCESVIIESYHSASELPSVQEVVDEVVDNVEVDPSVIPEVALEQTGVAEEQSTTELQDLYTNEFVDTESCSKSEFSNVEIGFQPEYNKNYIYLLQFDAIFSILTVTLPWHAKTQTVYDKSVRERLEVICEEIKDPFFNDHVLIHLLLYDKYFNDMLSRFFKFIDKNPLKIVQALLENN